MEVTYWNEFHVTKIKIKSTESKVKKYRIEFKNKNSVCHFYDIIDRGRRSFGSCREQLEMIDLVRRFPIDVGFGARVIPFSITCYRITGSNICGGIIALLNCCRFNIHLFSLVLTDKSSSKASWEVDQLRVCAIYSLAT